MSGAVIPLLPPASKARIPGRMKTYLATVSKSIDPSWVRWLVTTSHEAVWFFTRSAADKYADLIRSGESDKATLFARDNACQ